MRWTLKESAVRYALGGLVLLLIVTAVGVVRPTPVEAECQEFKLTYIASCNWCVWQSGDCTGC